MTEKLSEVDVPTMQVASMASDSNDPTDFAEFQSRNEDRITIETAHADAGTGATAAGRPSP
ncbi:MAG: hypothetical protein IPG66_18525 [Hydrogenophilales bacterium]|nr:hypothetical protein [Hydrogenophilales bacterium]